MGIFHTIKDCYNNWNSYENWETANQQKYAKKQYLFNDYRQSKPDEFKKLKDKSDIVMRTVNILDNASENAAEDMQVATRVVSGMVSVIPLILSEIAMGYVFFKGFNRYSRNPNSSAKFCFSPYLMLSCAVIDIPLVLWSTKKQIEASRVARTKTREEKLKNYKNFVIYTPSQIEQAKEKAKTIDDNEIDSEDKNDISLKNAFKSITNMDKEYNKYLKKYNSNLGIDNNMQKKLSENYTEKELLEANKDKELILTGIKEINNNAEKYCENAEAAFSTLELFNVLLIFPAMYILNKVLDVCLPKKVPKLITKTISCIAPIFLTFPIISYYNNKIKESAKVGRYIAKKEFAKDLSKLTYFDEKELKKAENIKIELPKKNIFKRVIDSYKFIPKYLKDREEYLDYKKTTWLEEEKLNKALKTIPISKKQEQEAKKLQEKVFFVFDELDEMSQKYSEHMEGALEVSKRIMQYTKSFIITSTFTIPAYLILSRNLHITTFTKKISDILFDKNSNIRKNIDEICRIAKQDKNIKAKLDRALLLSNKELTDLLSEPKISTQLKNLMEIFNGLSTNNLKRKEFFEKEFKHGKIATWLKNLTGDIVKVIAKRLQNIPDEKLNKIPNPKIKEAIINFKKIKIDASNLKTLKLTVLGATIPTIAGIVSISYLLNSFFAHLQKKAGYIGVMKSINKLDKTKYFAIHESEENDKKISDWNELNKKYFNCLRVE